MTTDITGGRNQPWISRDGLQRAFTRHAATVAASSLGLSFFLAGSLAYVGSLPREVPVYLVERVDGSIVPYQNMVTADDAVRKHLIVSFLSAWRLGCNDPATMCARQTSALVSSATGDPVAKVVREYNQSVADQKVRVTPSISSVTGSGSDWVADWTETATNSSGGHVERVMRAIVTLESAPGYVSMRDASLMNPFGIYLKDLRVIESGEAK